MMNKKRTSLAGLSKYALSLPLFALLFLSAYAWGAKHEIVSMNDIAAIAEPSPQVSNNAPKAQQTSSKDKVTKDKEKITSIDQVNVIGYARDNTPVSKSYISFTPPFERKGALLQAEQMPEFPGGLDALMKFIASELRYPASASDAGIEGRSVVRFIVSKTGDVEDVQTAKGFNPACDEEAMRVVKMMPKWIPGKDKGKAVSVYFTLPVMYRLQRPSAKSTSLASMAEKDAPLYIVDGVIKDKKYVDEISPNIESISVLKDSTATRQYGENGKNGVILITSKKTSK